MVHRVLVLVAIAACPAVAMADHVSVMTFNVRGDFDGGVATDKPNGWLAMSGEHRRDQVLRLVEQANPDLLGVQEAYANQVREVDAALPGHDVYAVGRDDGRSAGEHCAVYYRRSRFERLAAGTFWLSETPDEPSTFPGAACPRIASWVMLRDDANGGRELIVVNTHWDHVSAEARHHAAGLIRGRLERFVAGLPAIVMGDLNANEASEPLRTLLADGLLIDSYRRVHPTAEPNEATYHGFRGKTEGTRIDFVLATRDFVATDAEIVRQEASDGRLPSDHYPVTAELLWPLPGEPRPALD